jgi:hypothetical protein
MEGHGVRAASRTVTWAAGWTVGEQDGVSPGGTVLGDGREGR